MTYEEAIKYFEQHFPCGMHMNGLTPMQEAYNTAISVLEKQTADGCAGCAFVDVNEWEMPCAKCKRGCKDYWRAEKND